MTEYKEMIEVAKEIIAHYVAINNHYEEDDNIIHKEKDIKECKVLNKLITLAKAFGSAESVLPERKEEFGYIQEEGRPTTCGGCAYFEKECHMSINKLCQTGLRCDHKNLPPKRKLTKIYNKHYLGFNQALDLCKPLIVKRDIKIKALERIVKKLGEFMSNHRTEVIVRENSKLKEEIEELKKAIDSVEIPTMNKENQDILYSILHIFKTETKHLIKIDDREHLYVVNKRISTIKQAIKLTEKSVLAIVKLQQENQAIKDKMSEEEILKIINGSALAATAGVWWFESPNEDSIQEERFEIERIDLAKAIRQEVIGDK